MKQTSRQCDRVHGVGGQGRDHTQVGKVNGGQQRTVTQRELEGAATYRTRQLGVIGCNMAVVGAERRNLSQFRPRRRGPVLQWVQVAELSQILIILPSTLDFGPKL